MMKTPELSYTCDLKWTDLEGNGNLRRHCGQCDRDVYNLSGMTREQARRILRKDGAKCVHFVSRDGEIIHDGDPLEQLRRQRRGAAKLLAGALAVHTVFQLVGGQERVVLDPFTLIPAAIVRAFGTTVEEKYTMGNQAVETDVVF